MSLHTSTHTHWSTQSANYRGQVCCTFKDDTWSSAESTRSKWIKMTGLASSDTCCAQSKQLQIFQTLNEIMWWKKWCIEESGIKIRGLSMLHCVCHDFLTAQINLGDVAEPFVYLI